MECNDEGKIVDTIANLVDNQVVVCDLLGKIIYSNKPMQSYLGYNHLEIKEYNFLDVLADASIKKAKELIFNASNNFSEYHELLFNCKNNVKKLHMKVIKQSNYIYFLGNEKYVEYERIHKKLEVEIKNAIKIHRSSLPQTLPDTKNISFASLYIPAEDLGGDLFDVFKVDNGLLNDYFEQYVCYVADVSGHGLDSAMLAVFVKNTIRSYFKLKHIPGQVLSPKEIMDFFLEHYIKEGYPIEYLVCIFLVVIDLKTRELTYCNAGFHMCPIMISDENSIDLNNGGLPVSTAIDSQLYNYEDHFLDIPLGESTLFMMSDGLPEQRVNSVFYESRLKKKFSEVNSFEPNSIIQKIQEDFNDFLGNEKITDDITLIAVKILNI